MRLGQLLKLQSIASLVVTTSPTTPSSPGHIATIRFNLGKSLKSSSKRVHLPGLIAECSEFSRLRPVDLLLTPQFNVYFKQPRVHSPQRSHRPRASPRSHRGSPHDVFYYIVYSKLLANGELPAAVAFIMATPIFAGKAGDVGGTELLAGSGLDWTGVLRQ